MSMIFRAVLRLILFLILAGPLANREANGFEFDLHGADLWITGSTDWTGGGWGGYQPIPITVVNRGAARDLEFRFVPYDSDRSVPTVVRGLRIDAQATAQLALLVPLTPGPAAGRLSVLVDGRVIPELQEDMSLLEQSENGSPPSISLLFVSATEFEPRNYELAAWAAGPTRPVDAVNGPDPHHRRRFHNMGSRRELPRARTIASAALPSSWLGYSALDLVAIDLATLRETAPAVRDALFDWVATGGRLVIHKAGAFGKESSEFQTLLEQWRWNEPLSDWDLPSHGNQQFIIRRPFFRRQHDVAAPPNEGTPFPGIPDATWGGTLESPFPSEEFGGSAPWREIVVETSWPIKPKPFAIARHAFGRVVVVSDDLSVANAADWKWLLSDLGGPAIPWAVRYGLESGAGDLEFINLPIPGVRGVPTIAFLVLISLFAILIGPVNYILLWRKQQLSRLIVTVPLLAVMTSLMLFAYGTLAHGFSTRGRIRSVTWIDSASNSATSISRMSLFAGLAPSRGLQFSNNTAVYPLLPLGEEFQGGLVDWSDGQLLTDGWFNTRTRTQFVTVSHRDERGRLRVAQTNGGLTVTNGFSMTLDHVIVNDSRGRPHYGQILAPGAEQRLSPLTDEQRAMIRELAIDRIPEPPDGVEPRELFSALEDSIQRSYRYQWHPPMRLGLLERHLDLVSGSFSSEHGDVAEQGDDEFIPESANRMLAAVRNDTIDPLAAPRGFIAITTENPAIDVGELDVEERGSFHLLMGIW